MPVLRNKRRSADDLDLDQNLNSAYRKRRVVVRSRSRSLTDLNAQEKTTARATVSRENANDNNTATALEDSAEETLTDEVFYGFTDSESVFENQEVPDWTPEEESEVCLLYTSPSPRDGLLSRMPSSA